MIDCLSEVEYGVEYILMCIKNSKYKGVYYDDKENVYYIRLNESCYAYNVEDGSFACLNGKNDEFYSSFIIYENNFVYTLMYNMVSNMMGACLDEYVKLTNEMVSILDRSDKVLNNRMISKLHSDGIINKELLVDARCSILDYSIENLLYEIRVLNGALNKIHDQCHEIHGVSPNNIRNANFENI